MIIDVASRCTGKIVRKGHDLHVVAKAKSEIEIDSCSWAIDVLFLDISYLSA